MSSPFKLSDIMLRRFCSSVFGIKRRQHCPFRHIQTFAIPNRSSNVFQPTVLLTSTMEEQILKIINEHNEAELSKYNITKKNAKTLVKHRDTCGPFKSLDDLSHVNGISNNVLEKFYESLLNGKKSRSKSRKKKDTLAVTPVPDVLKNCKTLLGIHIGPNTISWALLDHKYMLLEWNSESMTEKTDNICVLHSVREVINIFQRMPTSDLYVMEETGSRANSKNNIMYLSQQQVSAVLMTCIAVRNNLQVAENLFMLRYNAVARYFGLLIGNEVVSSEHVVQKICNNTTYRDGKEMELHINVRDEVKYESTQKLMKDKENMNWALLSVAAFLHIDINKNPMTQCNN